MARAKTGRVEGARAAYREHLMTVITTYPKYGDLFADRMVAIDRGETLEVHGWEADLWPPNAEFALLGDGSAVQLVDENGR